MGLCVISQMVHIVAFHSFTFMRAVEREAGDVAFTVVRQLQLNNI